MTRPSPAGPTASPLGRRSVLGAGAGLGLAAALSACGQTTGPVSQPGGAVPGRYRGRTKVVLWSTFADPVGPALQRLVDAFNREQRDVYVEVQFQGTYDECAQKAVISLLGAQAPDLCVLSDVKWYKFYFGEALEPWDSYFEPGELAATYHPKLLSEGRAKGRTWWLPLARSTPLFYYNKTLFKKAGVPVRAPESYDELYAWSRRITRLSAGGQQVALEAYQKVDGDWQFQCSAWQFGGAYSRGLDVTIDQGGAVAAGEWQRKLIYKDRIAYMATEPTADMGNQLIATLVTSTGGLQKINEMAKANGWQLGTGFLPKKEKFAVNTGGGGLGMFRRVPRERKEAAATFVRFLARPENAAQWTVQTGYLPVVPAAVKEAPLVKLMRDDPNFTTAVRQLELTRKGDQVRMMIPNANVRIYTALQRIWSGNTPAQQAFSEVADQLRKGVDRYGTTIEEHL
ncbi:ABC transporter substrate-binding protein [Streptomyces sp. TS71-3]|uniref:ABC transporter substrate-binding protein n=1 Tax=Streptomyces sp. TS71-3 TaxID=2733862 RepID=UPI001B22EF28|nr:ABC transporter substrate-binding protein [Streptomyces sp. TS71-3]GHJ41080.1 ABC transporter substrate-binding protein [Streptomyces sp. TS71-3]